MRRRLCSAMLLLQAVVVGLSTPVLISVEGVDKTASLWIGIGLTVACLLLAGLLRFEWAYYAGFAVQVATIVLGILVTAMFVLGGIFGLLWFTAYRLGGIIDRDKAAVPEPG